MLVKQPRAGGREYARRLGIARGTVQSRIGAPPPTSVRRAALRRTERAAVRFRCALKQALLRQFGNWRYSKTPPSGWRAKSR
ncbi:hypothetical protein [Mycobacterium sp. URHB0044]|uniref:hypothetical protein n=1 Tax=Mycobacterium sp. URHB0044 TaxID=1380386 RepID=UPI00350F1C5D